MGPRWHIFAAAFCIGFVAACWANDTDGSDNKTIVCYWQSWSHKRLKPYTYNVDDIPVHLCTHVIYSYAKLDNEATSLYLDEGFDTGVAGYRHFIDLKRRFPSVKLLLALGDRYGSDLAAWKNNLDNPMRQFQVLKLLYQLLRQYNFDGVHFNWEWLPEVEGVRASGPTAMSFEKFNALIKATFRRQPPFIVSSTVSLPLLNWNGSQDSWIKRVQGYMDFFHLSSRSLSLGGDINTPISERINSSAANLLQSSSYDDLANGVHYLRHLGVPTNKLLLEIQFSGLNDPPISSSIHTVSPLTIGRKEDLVPYYEICASIREGASIYWDERQKSPYIILENGRRLHYEDSDSVRRKVKQARSLGITGVVGWSVDMDNFNGVNTTKNDLLRAAFESIIHTAESSTSHELSFGSLYEGTTQLYVTDEQATATATSYFDETTAEPQNYERTMVPINTSSTDGGITSEKLRTWNDIAAESNATFQYEGTHEDYTTTDDYFPAQTTETPEPEEKMTAFSSSTRDEDFITEGSSTENDTINEWNATCRYQRTGEDFTTTDDYFHAVTTKTPDHESTTAFSSSSHDDDSTNDNLSTDNYRTDEWNGTSHYTEKHEDFTRTDDYFQARTTETLEQEENITALSSSSHYDDFITEGITTENDTISEWIATSHYQRTGDDLTTTDDYFQAITTKTPEHESTTAFSSSAHDDDSTNNNFSTKNYRTDEWNGTSHYTERHDDYTTTDDYFAAQTTETPEHKKNITAFSSSTRDEDFITEGSSTEDDTINEWNVTSRYQRTGEDFTTTDDYFHAITTKSPEHESTTAFSSSSHDDDSTNDNFSTDNYRTDEWNGTSHYTEKHDDYTTSDDYFPAQTTETPEHKENITAFSSSTRDEDFITEGSSTKDDTINEWNVTSRYQRTGEDFTTTDDYFQAITTKTPEHESATAFSSSSHEDDSTNDNFSTENYRTDDWNGTSHYTEKHDDYTTSDDYFPAQTTETPEHEENITALSSSSHYDEFITEGITTEDTINERIATSHYQRTGDDFITTDDYFQEITTKTPEHESTTAFSSSSHDDDSTNNNFSTENYRTDEWNGTFHYTEKHEEFTRTDDYFRARTTETPDHEENITAFISSWHNDDFTTEDISTENDTINEWNATSHYQPTGESYATTDGYFLAITTETPQPANTTAFSSHSHDHDFTKEEFTTEKNTFNEWNVTSYYEGPHEDYTTTDDYFPAQTTDTQEVEINSTSFSYSPQDYDFTTEEFSIENGTINLRNATSKYEPTREAYTTTVDDLVARTTGTPEHESTTSFSSSFHDDDFTTEYLSRENGTINEWNVTSEYERTHEAYNTTNDYFPAVRNETAEHQENMTTFNSSPDYEFTTEDVSTENDTNNEWNATSLYEPSSVAYTSTVDYWPETTTESPKQEENMTSFSSSSFGADFTTKLFSTENDTNDEWISTSPYETTHEAYTSTDDYFPETTTAVVSTTDSALSNDQQSADWRCKKKTLTSVPHESDGEFFYRCYNGMALLRKCGEGQRFNFTLGRCNVVPSKIDNTSVGQQSRLSHVLMKFFGDLASGKARLGKDEKLDVNVNYSFSLNGKKS